MDLKSLVTKWSEILDEGAPIKNPKVKKATALMLENEFNYLNEAGNYSVVGRNNPSVYATSGDFHQIAIPMVRRTFPELVAHEIVGVQPMTGPVGLAFALRFRSGNTYNRQGLPMGSTVPTYTDELGYNNIDPWYSGDSTLSAGWLTSAGELLGSYGPTTSAGHLEQGLGIGTYAQIAEVNMTVEKAQVEAKTRKLRSRWSLEVAQDLKAMHGLDLEEEMMDMLAYEITAEIDREIVNAVNSAAVSSSWDYASSTQADGRWQMEKLRTLYSMIVRKANLIAINTRRGAGNFVIASPMVVAALESMSSFILAPIAGGDINSMVTGISKVGSLDGRISVFRDTFATTDYATIGYKGPSEYDAGIIFLPYVSLMVSKTVFEQSFQPTIGLLSRYAIHSQIFGSSNYYQRVTVVNLPS